MTGFRDSCIESQRTLWFLHCLVLRAYIRPWKWRCQKKRFVKNQNLKWWEKKLAYCIMQQRLAFFLIYVFILPEKNDQNLSLGTSGWAHTEWPNNNISVIFQVVQGNITKLNYTTSTKWPSTFTDIKLCEKDLFKTCLYRTQTDSMKINRDL